MGCSPWGHEESDTTERLHFRFSLPCTGEGHGNPLQCSCLENPRDGGAWWAAVSGVAQSRTRLSDSAAAAAVAVVRPQTKANELLTQLTEFTTQVFIAFLGSNSSQCHLSWHYCLLNIDLQSLNNLNIVLSIYSSFITHIFL